MHAPLTPSIIAGIAFTGTWCAPGIREGGGAGPVAWRKRGWKFSSEARARFAAPPHRQRPPRGPRRSGKTTGGALGRRHTFTLRGADPAPRFPTAPEWESSLTMARRESGRGNGEACVESPLSVSGCALDTSPPKGVEEGHELSAISALPRPLQGERWRAPPGRDGEGVSCRAIHRFTILWFRRFDFRHLRGKGTE